MRVLLANIAPDPKQPRKTFAADALQELADSIRENGLIQPPTVRPAKAKGHYWIVTGERRFRAHQLLHKQGVRGFDKIEVTVAAPPDEISLRVRQIIENTQRADLPPLEEAQGYQALLDLGLDEDQAARKLGVPVARVIRMVTLLKLEPTIAGLLQSGQLSPPHAMELSRLPDHADQLRLLKMLNGGQIDSKWYKPLRAAVDGILGGLTQSDMFGAAPKAKAEDVKTLTAMERKIEDAARLLSAGWKNGECVVAAKVSPDRARVMAQKLAAIRSTVHHMERELTTVMAQAEIAV